MPGSRFRPEYRKLLPAEAQLIQDIKVKAEEMEVLINQAGAGRHAALAMTALEESVMWAVKQVTT